MTNETKRKRDIPNGKIKYAAPKLNQSRDDRAMEFEGDQAKESEEQPVTRGW